MPCLGYKDGHGIRLANLHPGNVPSSRTLGGYAGMNVRESEIRTSGKPRLTEGAQRIVQLYEFSP
jgi:hypothetical protein